MSHVPSTASGDDLNPRRVAQLHRELARIHAELALEIDGEPAAANDDEPPRRRRRVAPVSSPRPVDEVAKAKARSILRRKGLLVDEA